MCSQVLVLRCRNYFQIRVKCSRYHFAGYHHCTCQSLALVIIKFLQVTFFLLNHFVFQYVIKAPKSGVIEKVLYHKGDNVSKNTVLLKFKEETTHQVQASAALWYSVEWKVWKKNDFCILKPSKLLNFVCVCVCDILL